MVKSYKSKYVDFEVRLKTSDIINELRDYVAAKVEENTHKLMDKTETKIRNLEDKHREEVARLIDASIKSEATLMSSITALQRAIIQLKSELDSVKTTAALK